MTPEPIPVRAESMLECRNCGAGAPVDEHFCPSCSRILMLGRHGDYFSFLGVPRRLNLDPQELEQRFRDLSRKFHPDYYYNASPAERLASLERSSYLNDAYRALRSPASRIEHLLAIEGLPPAKSAGTTDSGHGTLQPPAALLEEVFALNEELDEIRELRESGADSDVLRGRLELARKPIDQKREEHEEQLRVLSEQWDALPSDAAPEQKKRTLEALRERLLERNYINNLLATIDREGASVETVAGADAPGPKAEARRP
jgi:molecular chaperone HscB